MTSDDPTTPVDPGPGGGFAPAAPPDAASAGGPSAAPPPPPSGASGWDAGAGSAPGYGSTPPSGGAPGYGAPPPSGGAPSWSPSPSERGEPQSPGLVIGIVLVAVGSIFLALRIGNFALGPDAWPLWLIVPGLAMVAGSLFIPSRGGLGLAIPGAILAIVGGILWVQAAYGLYETWAYAWALVAPTGPGLAMLLYGAVHRQGDIVRDGLGTTLTGIGLFLGFGLFFEGVIGISGHRIENLDQVLPYAAIGLGVLLIVLAFIDGGRRDTWRSQRRAEHRALKDRMHAERQAARDARRAAR